MRTGDLLARDPRANIRARLGSMAAELLLAVAGSAWALSPWQPSAADAVGAASVIDGDTLEIRGERIRLHGIDAPEADQLCTAASGAPWRCGQQAALALADRIGRATIACDTRDRDRYGRTVAVCIQGGIDLNNWLVANGWAVAYRDYSDDYVPAEAVARDAAINLWSGTFEMPWDHRASGRAVARAPAPETAAGSRAERADCSIKGNISRAGERIYHVPGGRFYDRTGVDEAAGERWFCDAAEAEAAGWRRARR